MAIRKKIAGPGIPYHRKLSSARRSANAYFHFQGKIPTASFLARRWGISLKDAAHIVRTTPSVVADEGPFPDRVVGPRPTTKGMEPFLPFGFNLGIVP